MQSNIKYHKNNIIDYIFSSGDEKNLLLYFYPLTGVLNGMPNNHIMKFGVVGWSRPRGGE